MAFSADGLLASIEPLTKPRGIADHPRTACGVVDGDASLGHHLLKIT